MEERIMQYVNLGKSGLKVSRLCLGMMSYGSKKWRDWVLEEWDAKPFVKRALDAGINFFDTVITSYSIHYTKLYDVRRNSYCAKSRRELSF